MQVSFSLPELIGAFLTIVGIFSTAYGIFINVQNRKKAGIKEVTDTALKWAEIESNMKTFNIQTANILTTIGEFKTSLGTLMINVQEIKQDWAEVKHRIDRVEAQSKTDLEHLRREIDSSIIVMKNDISNLNARIKNR